MLQNEVIIKPKRPFNQDSWERLANPLLFTGVYAEAWKHKKQNLVVISAVEAPDERIGAEYHITVSKGGSHRCTSNEGNFVKKQFGMTDSDEDNHGPMRLVRSYWLPVADEFKGEVCDCKETEPAINLDKGDFIWRPLE